MRRGFPARSICRHSVCFFSTRATGPELQDRRKRRGLKLAERCIAVQDSAVLQVARAAAGPIRPDTTGLRMDFAEFLQTKRRTDGYREQRSPPMGTNRRAGGVATWILRGSCMYWLDSQQKELILDYCLGRCSPSQRAEAENLIDHNEAALQLRSKMEEPLRPLAYHPPVEQCPDRLAEITVQRLCQLARAEGRFKPVEPRVIQIGFRRHLRPMATVAAAAACLVFAIGVLSSRGPYQDPPQAYQQNAGGFLRPPAIDGFEWVRSYAVDGNENSELSPGIPWPGEVNPYPAFPFLQQGPPMLPASLRESPEFHSLD